MNNRFPAGWDAERLRRVVEHYERQTEEEAAVEDEESGVTNFIVREAAEPDQQAILDIYNEAVLGSTATFDLGPRTWDEQQRWFEEHRPPYQVFIATTGGTVAGWGSLSPFRVKPGYRFTAEDSIYVHKDFRRQGVGAALLERLIEAAQHGGLHSIMALIDGDNAVSVRLHERFGFRPVGTFREVGFKFDRWLDVVHMQKMLDPRSAHPPAAAASP